MHTRRHFLSIATAALAAASTRGLADGSVQDLLFIHGRAQDSYDRVVLESQWMEAFRRGAQKLGRPVPSTVKVSFPVYAKTLDDFAKAASLPLSEDIRTRGTAPDDRFLAFQQQMADELRVQAGITDQQVQDEVGNGPGQRGPLNWEWVQAILRVLDRHAGGLGQFTIEQFTRDVYLYLTRIGVRDAIDEIVRSSLTSRPTIVVAHSLGSVIAYNVLRTAQAPLNVPLLVTVGCPLGIRAVRNRLIPLRFPGIVRAWHNAFDPRDVVALYPLDGSNFPVSPAVTNFSGVQNHTDNRHGIDGYLDDADVAARLLDGLA